MKPTEDNMLSVTGDGRRAALDLREVGLEPPAEPQKLDVLADRVAAIWRAHEATRATQVVFCDLSTPKAQAGRFSFYTALREALVARGIPRAEVAFIHEAASDRDKLQLFEAVNEGRVRVIVGSTEKLGTGVNIQRLLVAAHHADAPWRPSDVAQRNGRIERPGNTHAQVHIYYYVTAGSFDAYMWQTLEIKQNFIQQILRGEITERSLSDLGASSAFTPAEVKALASGRPEIMEVVRLDSEIGRLTALRVHHDQSQRNLHFDLQSSERRRVRLAGEIEAIGADLDRVRDVWRAAGERSPGITIGGTHHAGEGYRKPAAAALGQALHGIIQTARRTRDDQLVHSVGSYLGLDIRAGVVGYQGEKAPVFRPIVWLRGEHQYDRIQPDLEQLEATLASLESRARPHHLEHELAERQRAHEATVQRIADLRQEVGRPFESADLLRELAAQRDAIIEGLKLHEPTPGEVLVEAPAEAPVNDLPPPDALAAALERGDDLDHDHAR